MDKRLENWCDQVLSQVRCWMDHNAIRAELEAHIEDRCMALEELNYPPELAAERTLAAMGDPVTVGKALDKEHSLWLGRLWLASVVAVFLMSIIVVIEVQESGAMVRRFWDRVTETVSPIPYEERWELLDESFDACAKYGPDFDYTCIGISGAAPVDAGKWTVEIPKAVWWNQFDKFTCVAVLLTVTPEKPWYGSDFENLSELVLTDSNGDVTLSSSARMNMAKGGGLPSIRYADKAKSLGRSAYLIDITIKGDADWVELRWPYGDSPWTLRLEKEGAA